MKLLKIVVATTMVIAFATSVFASVCEEAPEIVEFFDRYLIVKK